MRSGVAALLRQSAIGAVFTSPRLFEISVGGKKKTDHGLKFGFTEMTLIKEISLPVISPEQKIAFGILCAKEVYKEEKWILWADNWLSGKDRAAEAAASESAAACGSGSGIILIGQCHGL